MTAPLAPPTSVTPSAGAQQELRELPRSDSTAAAGAGSAARPHRRVLAGLILLFVLASSAWLWLDTAPPLWDQAEYLARSELLHQTLRDDGAGAFLEEFRSEMGPKPVLISVLPLPLYALLGESQGVAEIVNLLWIVLASLYLFRLGERIATPRAGVLAVVALNTFPLVAGMSRQFLVEYGLMAVVIMFVYQLVRWLDGERRAALPLGVLLGVGLLLKVTFPLYVAAPFLAALAVKLVREKGARPAIALDLALVAALGGSLAAMWYAGNLELVSSFVRHAGYSEGAAHYGTGSPASWRSAARYWFGLINHGISTYYALLLLAAACASAWRHWREGASRTPLTLGWMLLLVWWLVPFAVLTLGVNKDLRFAVPYLPAVALLLGSMGDALAKRRRGATTLALLAGLGVAHYLYFSFAGRPRIPELRLGRFDILSCCSLGWGGGPTREHWPNREIVRWLAGGLTGSTRVAKVTVLFSHPRINLHNLWYASALESAPLRFDSFPRSPRSAAQELAQEVRERADFVLLKSGPRGPGFLDTAHAAIDQLLRQDPGPLQSLASFPLPDQGEITVLGRRSSSAPAGASANATATGAVRRVALWQQGIAIVDHDLVTDGDGNRLSLTWLCTRPMGGDFRVFVHVLDSGNRIVAQADHFPVPAAPRPTSTWRVGEVIRYEIPLSEPPAEDQRIYVGWYTLADLRQIPVVGGGAADAGEPHGIRVR